MIKLINVDTLLPIRNDVLREGKLTPDECRFPSDMLEGAFHLGYYQHDVLVSVVSFHPQNYDGYNGAGNQLRGMATLPGYRGKGFGNQLVNFAIIYLRGRKVNYIWCNARKKAVNFYANIGFEIVSPEFDVPGIGPHHVMYLKIQ